MYNPPPKLLAPAPRNISMSEDFLGRTRLFTWTKAAIWPLMGAFTLILYGVRDRHLLMIGVVMFLVLTVIGAVIFATRYSKLKKTVKLLNEGIICNGIVQYYVRNFRNGVTDFEMMYTDPNGTTFKGTVGLAYYNHMKFPLPNNSVVPLFIDPQDPTRFTIYVPKCGLNIGKASWF